MMEACALVLENARSLLARFGGKVPYKLGPKAKGWPHDCDCSLFAALCTGLRKVDPATGLWWNTDRIYTDAVLGTCARWRQIAAPTPGCIGVYPGKPGQKGRIAGHVWIVEDPARASTIECSSSGKGIGRRLRPQFFKAGAKGNGKPIIWCVPTTTGSLHA